MSKGIRIPLADAIANCKIIEDLLPSTMEYMVVGSIRRNTETCGDGDIVFWEKDRSELTSLILKAKDEGIIAKVITMMTGSIVNVTLPNEHKIDFWFAEENGWWHKIQFYTGSHDYNDMLINKIRPTGKALGRTGYYDELGQRITVGSEEELFSSYGLDYVLPENRSLII